MAIHGIRVDDAALQKVVDNVFARRMRKIVKAGEQGTRYTAEKTIEAFYSSARKGHFYDSLPRSLQVTAGPIRQDAKQAWSDIEIRIDEDMYRGLTEGRYNIYSWANKKRRKGELEDEGFNPAGFVLNLQWSEGIVGLPDPYPNYSTSPLKALLEDEIDRVWQKNVYKFMK